ncbi:MAG: NFACT family protein [Firmicutes bacterium]|nr:NFACT family protein [Bacillota bacterium]
MPLDAPVLARLAQELNRMLPVKIDKIHQPYPDEFIFSCFGSGAAFKILISVNAQYGRFTRFDGSRENPQAAPPFCMLLRKHFGGAKLIQIETIPFERVGKFTFETYDAFQGACRKTLWVELAGKSANLIAATCDGVIIDAWRRMESSQAGQREILTGVKYELPDSKGRWKPVTVDLEQFADLLASVPPEVQLEEVFLKQWYGLSALTVRQLAAAAGLNPETRCRQITPSEVKILYARFTQWAGRVAAGAFEPSVLVDGQGRIIDFSAFPVTDPPENLFTQPINNLNETVSAAIENRQEAGRFLESQRQLARQVKQQLEKARVKLGKQEAEAAVAGQSEYFKTAGELLTAYGQSIKKGSATASLPNYYDPSGAELSIALNPALTAQENAQAYFKKYQKAKKGQLAISAQIAKTRETIDYLESLEVLIQTAGTMADLQLIRDELAQTESQKSGLFPKSKKTGGRPVTGPRSRETLMEPRKYISEAGHQILAGRNNIQNDRLTFKIAGPEDLWFHTQKIPGSHVILKLRPGVALDEETLNDACQIAVYFSKGQPSTKVPVDYTRRKNVKKPPGAKPGFVIYDFFQTAIITPDERRLQRLFATAQNGAEIILR